MPIGGPRWSAGSIQFLVASGSPNSAAPLSVASNGAACAGNWDPTATLCNPGTSGIAIVTAVINGVSSPPTTVYVHQHVASIQITPARVHSTAVRLLFPRTNLAVPGYRLQQQWTDITNTVGPMTWSFSNTGVLTTDTTYHALSN